MRRVKSTAASDVFISYFLRQIVNEQHTCSSPGFNVKKLDVTLKAGASVIGQPTLSTVEALDGGSPHVACRF